MWIIPTRYSGISRVSHQNTRRASEVTPNPASDPLTVSCIKTMCPGKSSRTEQPFGIFALVLSYASPKLPSPEVGPTYFINPQDLFSF